MVEVGERMTGKDALQQVHGIDLDLAPMLKLYQNIRITYSARFNASRRLAHHQRWSLWTITLISVGMVMIPLLSVFNVPLTVASGPLNVLQIVSGVMVIAFSVIVNMSRYSHRAERLHLCGVELKMLGREMYNILDREIRDEEYVDFLGRYNGILTRYESHSNVDFAIAKAEKQRGDFRFPGIARGLAYVRLFAQFVHYLVLVVLGFFCIFSAVDWNSL